MAQTTVAALAARNEDALLYRNLHRHFPAAERGEGIYIWDSEGRRYIDACGGAMVTSIGHGVQEVADAYARQAGRIAFAHSHQFTNRPAQELAERIGATTPGELNRIYFVNSGSEATETAIKLARSYHVERGQDSRYKVIGRWGSYHGATLGAMSMSGQASVHERYRTDLGAFPHIEPVFCRRCPYGKTYPDCGLHCADELERRIQAEGPETVSAFIAEPVVGASLGASVPPDGYWQRVREICDRHGVLLIADEVLCGMGRTGRVWAINHWDVVPDMLVMAKGITSGYAPLAAVAMKEDIQHAIEEGSGTFVHGHTYSLHAPCCAVSLAVFDYIERHGLFDRVASLSRHLFARLEALRSLESVWDIRGIGLLVGVEFAQDKASGQPYPPAFEFYKRLGAATFARGLVVYPGRGTVGGNAGDHVLVAPHFITSEAEADEIVSLLGEAIADVERQYRQG